MTKETAALLRLWGKSADGDPDYHPLLFHLLDVGSGPDTEVFDVAVERTGTILVAGNFLSFSGLDYHGLVRLKGADSKSFVFWKAPEFASFEKTGRGKAIIRRAGNTNAEVTVQVRSFAQTAASEDFTPIDADATFAPGEVEKVVPVSVADNVTLEGRRTFGLGLSSAMADGFWMRMALPIGQSWRNSETIMSRC